MGRTRFAWLHSRGLGATRPDHMLGACRAPSQLEVRLLQAQTYSVLQHSRVCDPKLLLHHCLHSFSLSIQLQLQIHPILSPPPPPMRTCSLQAPLQRCSSAAAPRRPSPRTVWWSEKKATAEWPLLLLLLPQRPSSLLPRAVVPSETWQRVVGWQQAA